MKIFTYIGLIILSFGFYDFLIIRILGSEPIFFLNQYTAVVIALFPVALYWVVDRILKRRRLSRKSEE